MSAEHPPIQKELGMTTRVTLGIDPELAMKRFDPRRIISEEEQLIYLQGAMPFLIRKAREAANRHSVSYRGFRVGCAAYAYRPDAYYIEDRHKIFLGANLKPNHDKTRWPKVCAEQVAILGARSAGYTRVIGLVVAGEPQADEESGIISPTLTPVPLLHLAIEVPDDEKVVNTKTITLNGKTTPDAIIIVTTETNDQVFTPAANGNFSTTVTLISGANVIIVTAVAQNGEEKSITRTITYSTETF